MVMRAVMFQLPPGNSKDFKFMATRAVETGVDGQRRHSEVLPAAFWDGKKDEGEADRDGTENIPYINLEVLQSRAQELLISVSPGKDSPPGSWSSPCHLLSPAFFSSDISCWWGSCAPWRPQDSSCEAWWKQEEEEEAWTSRLEAEAELELEEYPDWLAQTPGCCPQRAA